ncbi:MAG: GDP-mannose 4,6-dehydratase [Gemmatimonadota bacterium]|nr:GDP-mannose 4,6-dehydratase [Gemmatimonadota bacterium]
MPTVMITGGAGFIGSHVADRFLAEGWTVHVVDNLVTGKRENVADGVVFHEVDVRSPDAAGLVATLKPQAIIHLAAQMDVRKSVTDPVFDANTNIVGTLNLLEAVRHHSLRTRIVFSSTGGALYGDYTTPPNVETFAKDPESPYAISKLSVELYLAYYGRVHGIDSVALRFGNVYGPRQDPHGEAGVVAIFCGRILDGKSLTIFGDGSQTRDYVYVGDIAEATWRAATQALPAIGQLDARAFNLGTGVGTPVVRIVDVLRNVAGREVVIEHAPRRAGEQQESFVAVEKAGALLGWRPAVSLEEGLARSYAWFSERRTPRAHPTSKPKSSV